MAALNYPAKLSRDEGGRVLVQFPDLRGVATDGRDLKEALAEAEDCLGSDLSIRMARKEEIPAPSAPKRDEHLVPVPLWLAPKLALYIALREQRVSNSELARRLGWRETSVRRMLDPGHISKPENIQRALAALGKRLSVAMDDAA